MDVTLEKLERDLEKQTDKKKCEGCRFTSSYGICDYCLIMGHSRGAKYDPVKKRCAKYEEKKQKKTRKTVNLKGSDIGMRHEIYDEMSAAAPTAQKRRVNSVPIDRYKLSEQLKKNGLTQDEFGKLVGSTGSGVRQIMRRGTCRMQTITKYAETLGCCVADLSG